MKGMNRQVAMNNKVPSGKSPMLHKSNPTQKMANSMKGNGAGRKQMAK